MEEDCALPGMQGRVGLRKADAHSFSKLHGGPGRERGELGEQQERGQIRGKQGYHARDLDTAQ